MSDADVERNYIKFSPVADMAFGLSVRDAEAKVGEIINCEFSDIVAAVEGHNIVRLFDEVVERAVIRNGGESKKKEYKTWAKQLRSKIGKFAGGIQECDVFNIYASVPLALKDDFWKFFHDYKIWKKFSGSFLADFEKYPEPVFGLFEDKNFVSKFGGLLSRYLRGHFPLAVEMFVRNTLLDVLKKYYFPKELSSEDKESIVRRYVDSDFPSINSLRMIADNLLCIDECKLSSKVRFRAKKRLEDLIRDCYPVVEPRSNFIECCSEESLGEAVLFEQSGNSKWRLCFSRKWICENLDYPTLLNNLIFIFEFVDKNCRSRLVQPSVQTLFDSFSQKSDREYYIGEVQREFWSFQAQQIEEYFNVLRESGVHLEDVFRWFFQDYLKEEFGVEGFTFNVLSEGATYEQKCRIICPEIEKVLKLWKMYCEDGAIDSEFFEFAGAPLVTRNLPSLCKRKYIYAKSKECKAIIRLLFSTQSRLCLGSVARIDGKYKSPFSEILSRKKLNVSDFEEFQGEELNFLIEKGILEEDGRGDIEPHWEKINILREINNSGVYCSLYHPEFDKVIREMYASGWIEEGATLFSRQEEDLLNFIFNDRDFNNSLGLRNKYLHGSNSFTEIVNKRDYMLLLIVVVLVVLKINEDLRLSAPEEKRFSGVWNFVWDIGRC